VREKSQREIRVGKEEYRRGIWKRRVRGGETKRLPG